MIPMDTIKTFVPKDTADLAFSKWKVFVIGCGGTGSYIVPELARLWSENDLIRERIGSLTVVDPDIVDDRNVIRQRFVPADVGQPKARVVANRYSNAYGVSIGFAEKRLTADDFGELIPSSSFRNPILIVAAVDSPESRRAIHEGIAHLGAKYRQAVYWLGGVQK